MSNVDSSEPIISTASYPISKIKKLIDINHDMINFKVDFTITSDSDQPFEALVVDQSTLDTVEPNQLKYKTVDGELSGEIVADKNVYQNYFIILKSEIPTSVTVELKTTHLPDYIDKGEKIKKKQKKTKKETYINIKYIIAVAIAGIILYLFVSKLTSNSTGISILSKNNINQSLLAKLKKLSLE